MHNQLSILSSQGIMGIDGCPGGWLVFRYRDREYDFGLYRDLRSVESLLTVAPLSFIDVPVGLADRNVPRDVDRALRACLTGRKSSVFTPPCREAVYSDDYQLALKINRHVTGRGISKQSYHLASKIRQADQLLKNVLPLRQTLCESHPEYLFSLFNQGRPMQYSKRDPRGIKERLAVLSSVEPSSWQLYGEALKRFPRKKVRRDDITDALCLAIGARLAARHKPLFITGSHARDSLGIPMRIGYFPRSDSWENSL